MRHLLTGLSFLLTVSLFSEVDPFWPIGYKDTPSEPTPTPTALEEPQPQPEPTLTDADLRALALKEAEKIKEILDRDGTAVFGGRVHALVNNNWVSVGDTITVQSQGETFRLKIISLTTDNIDLKPERIRAADTKK